MAGISICGVSSAGGIIQPGPNRKVFYHGNPVAVVGCQVTGHGSGSHSSAVMVTGSTKVFIDGIPICMAGSRASCGDVANGVPNYTTTN